MTPNDGLDLVVSTETSVARSESHGIDQDSTLGNKILLTAVTITATVVGIYIASLLDQPELHSGNFFESIYDVIRSYGDALNSTDSFDYDDFEYF